MRVSPGLTAVVAAVMLLGGSGTLGAQENSDRLAEEERQLASLLERLKLDDLRVLHLEGQLDSTTGKRQIATAKKLADVYAEAMLTGDAEKQRGIREKIQALVQRVPEADTPGLGIMLLQADFQLAEADSIAWLNEADQEAKKRAAPMLAKLAPDLTQRQRGLAAEVEALENQLDTANLAPTQEAELEKKLRRATLLSLRARFLGGWAGYYDGVVNGNPRSLADAKLMLRDLLSLNDEDARVTPEWMGLDVAAKARSLIGLALIEIALDNATLAENYFKQLESPIVLPELRDQVPQWHVRGLLNAGRQTEAVEAAKHYIATFPNESSPGRAAMCVALVEAAKGAERTELRELGIRGLAKLGEFKLVRQLVEKHAIKFVAPEGFYLRWVAAQQQLDKANQSKAPADYEMAQSSFAFALKAERNDVAAKTMAVFHNEHAWTLFHSAQFERAGRVYGHSADTFSLLGLEDAAVKARWMAFVAYQRGAGDSDKGDNGAKSAARSAVSELKAIVRDYPDTDYARKAKYQLLKLDDKGDSQASLSQMEQVKPNDPQYATVRFDICVLRHQRWTASKGEATEADEAKRLIQAVDRYLTLGAASDGGRKLRVALLAVEAAADGKPTQPQVMLRMLNVAGKHVERGSVSLQANYHYQSLRRDLSINDPAGAERHARWLLDHPSGKAYEQTALVSLAKSADRRLAAATEENRTAALRSSLEVYQRLSKLLGQDVGVLSQNRNAQVAMFKAADYQLQLGDAERSAGMFETLLEVSAKNRQFVRGAALAYFQLGRFEESIAHWRNIVRASKDGEDVWYEAKYHQIVCLFELKDANAAKVLKQFQVFHPDPPGRWADKFRQLANDK